MMRPFWNIVKQLTERMRIRLTFIARKTMQLGLFWRQVHISPSFSDPPICETVHFSLLSNRHFDQLAFGKE